jgi:hypothetical protein
VDDTGKHEEEGSSHQRKKAYQKKKHLRKHPKHESDENSGKEKKTTWRWVKGRKRKEKDSVVKRVAVGKVEHRQGWDAKEDQ